MSIILQKDIFKKQFERKNGILLLSFVSFILVLIIISNILWIGNYDIAKTTKAVSEKIKNPTKKDLDTYIRLRAIISIISNTLILGFFVGMIWWSISKKRLGIFFGVFWFIVFLVNSIYTPFYSINLDFLSIIIAVLHGFIALILFYWIVDLLKMKSRIQNEIARKG